MVKEHMSKNLQLLLRLSIVVAVSWAIRKLWAPYELKIAFKDPISFLLIVHPGKKGGLKANFGEQTGQSTRVPKRIKLPRDSGCYIELMPHKIMPCLEVSQHVAVVRTCFVITHEATM